MKKVYLFLLCFLLIAASASGVWAQGLFGSSAMPGAGLLSSVFPGGCSTGKCADPGCLGGPTVYVGWLEHSEGSRWTLQTREAIGTASWRLKGVWLGASQDIPLSCDGLGATISGAVLVPERMRGAWVQDPNLDRVYNLTVPSYEWWYGDGMIRQSIGGAFEALLGFRWDHTSIRIKYDDNSDDDYVLNSYIPFAGAQIRQAFGNGALTVRAIGTPILWGSVKYHFWDGAGYTEQANFTHNSESYFMEFFTDYKLRVAEGLCLGAFAKWNTHHVRTSNANLRGGSIESISPSVDIRSWVLGVDASIAFSLPW